MEFSFKLWLEVDAATYNAKFKQKTDKTALERIDPFAKFFPRGQSRIYFKPTNVKMPAQFHATLEPENISIDDRAVVNALLKAGYKDIDYTKGYATKGKRIERIGKILDRLIATTTTPKELAELQKAKQRFITAPQRGFATATAQDMWVILSQNPHDIAQMSFSRTWVSCMNIDGGQYCRSPYAVIRSGGLVAYLINAPESTVAKIVGNENEYIPSKIAVARVSIKTAINANTGEAIAVPERRVYPMNIPGFWESVNAWLEKHQEGEGGRYRMYGGYSDTHQRGSYIHVPRDHNGIYSFMKSSNIHRQHAALDYIFNSADDFPLPIWQKAKEIILNNLQYSFANKDFVNKMAYLMKKFPNFVSKEDIEKISYENRVKLGFVNNMEKDLNQLTQDYVDPLNPNDFSNLLRTLDQVKETGLSDAQAFMQLANWLKVGRYGYSSKKSEADKTWPEQQKVVVNKLLDMLANQDWKKLFAKADYSSLRHISNVIELAIERFMNDENLPLIKRVLMKIKNMSGFSSQPQYELMYARNKLIGLGNDELAKKVSDAYEEIYGHSI